MRARSRGSVKALAVAGSRVVLLGWDLPASTLRKKGVLGFGIQRTRHRDNEVTWLRGMKTFWSVLPYPGPGVQVSSREHPFQSFQWADYSVAPGERYTYKVTAMLGTPGKLREGPSATLAVRTEGERVGKHSVYFNRGAIASQEYARRFQNRPPEEIGQAAWDWLSRGLVEGLEHFIGQASSGDALYGAIFEFKHERVFAALKAAKGRGADVFVLYDGKSQRAANEKAMAAAGVTAWLEPETHLRARKKTAAFSHNKFFVLARRGTPRQVFTGSTNLSTNGLFGHSNNAHVVRDSKVARAYKTYWDRLWQDPPRAALALENAVSRAPPPSGKTETRATFSPLPDESALDGYVALAARPKAPLFATFAFGMNEKFVPIYERRDGVLRFALMEKKGNGKQLAAQTRTIDRIRRLPNTVVAIGDSVDESNTFERWLKERTKVVNEAHVLFVHTKYALIDPLGPEPVLIVGSANFSKASSVTNDENMLVVRGNQALADIYLGEFIRLHTHYAYREALGFQKAAAGATTMVSGAHAARPGRRTDAQQNSRNHLLETPDWIDGGGNGQGYFERGAARTLRRVYFSGGKA